MTKGEESSNMPTIHINTGAMRQLGQIFVRLDEQIGNQIEPQIRNYIGQLDGDWQGASRQHFDQVFQDWRNAINRIVQQGEQIGRHLQNTAQEFDNVDAGNNSQFSKPVYISKKQL